MTTIEIKYLTQPHDGTPGTPWDDFEERILFVAAGKTDDRGWSLSCFSPSIFRKEVKAPHEMRARERPLCALIGAGTGGDGRGRRERV